MARGSTERVLLVSQLVFIVVGGKRGGATSKVGTLLACRLEGVGRSPACAGGGAAATSIVLDIAAFTDGAVPTSPMSTSMRDR